MDVNEYLPKTSDEYINCFKRLAALVNKAMDEVGKTEFISGEDKSCALKRIADGVETVACLRGDSGIFYAGRPEGISEYQKEMYRIEYALRDRLLSLGYTYPKR